MNATRGLGPEKMTFMAEGKPGHPDAYNERMLNNAQRRIEQLVTENDGLRKEISRLSRRYTETYRAVKKVFESGAGQ